MKNVAYSKKTFSSKMFWPEALVDTNMLYRWFLFGLLFKLWFHGKPWFDLNECSRFYVASTFIGFLFFFKLFVPAVCISRGMCIPSSFDVFLCVFLCRFLLIWGHNSSLKFQSFHFKPCSNSIQTFYGFYQRFSANEFQTWASFVLFWKNMYFRDD